MIGQRAGALGRRLRPRHRAHWVLAGLVLAGLALRTAAMVSWWPVVTALADSFPYAYFAETGPLDNPQHPAGYSWLLAAIGVFSREVAFTVVLQHLGGVATALLLYATVGRLTGSPWPGLVPAALVLLSADQVFLEHAIMSEAPFTLVIAAALYCSVRALDAPSPLWGWPLAAGLLIAAAAFTRSAALFLAPVVVIALLLARPLRWRRRLGAPAVVAGVVAASLLAYAAASSAVNGRFEISPTQGWHLYARVAPFADCSRFDPPEGTDVLCESTPPAERQGLDYYLYDARSPGRRNFEFYEGESDDEVGAFAREVVLNQPGDYLETVWEDLKGYYVPSEYAFRVGQGGNLEGQVDWGITLRPHSQPKEIRTDTEAGMETFFEPFSVDLEVGAVEALNDYQRVARFGATALTITTLLTLAGLLVGPRRHRLGALILGVGGLTLLVAPTLTIYYLGRYTVPLAGPIAAAASIAAFSIWQMESRRRARAREATARSGPA